MSAKVLLQQWWWFQEPHLRWGSVAVLPNRLQAPTHSPRGFVSLLSIGIRCGYTEKPPDFSVDYDPFEDFFGLGIDMKTRKQAENTDDSRSSYVEYDKMVPCPVCRGRGHVLDSPKGPNICSNCVGKGMVPEDSVWESAWERAQTRSSLRVEDDDVLDKIDPDVPKRPERRVYGPRPETVRKRISRTLKELERRTGALSKRAKRQHRNPIIHSRMAAAIKRAKNTEAARMKVSQNQKLFFQNPENRRMRGLQMKGVKFRCKQCGQEGHRRHFCPELGYVKKEKERVYRCGMCQQLGHTRRQCPQLHREEIGSGSGAEVGEANPPQRQEKEVQQQRRRGLYKCGHCHQPGHTRRTCLNLHQHKNDGVTDTAMPWVDAGEDMIVEKRLQYAAGKVSSISLVKFKSQMKVLAETHHNGLEEYFAFCDEKREQILVQEYTPRESTVAPSASLTNTARNSERQRQAHQLCEMDFVKSDVRALDGHHTRIRRMTPEQQPSFANSPLESTAIPDDALHHFKNYYLFFSDCNAPRLQNCLFFNQG